MKPKIMKCGCAANSTCSRKGGVEFNPPIPLCVIHDCYEIAEKQPDLTGRKARCTYYGKSVKTSSYNANCCNKCKGGSLCSCEEESSNKLWFFKHKPEEEFDEYYCACHGAD